MNTLVTAARFAFSMKFDPLVQRTNLDHQTERDSILKTPRRKTGYWSMNYLPSACTICDSTHRLSDGAQIVRRRLAGLSIGNNVERHLLSFVKAVHPGAFDRADVHEDVLATIMRLDEAEAFLAVEPLDGSLRHRTLPSEDVERRPRASTAGWFEIWRKAVSPTRERGEAKSFGRNSIGQCGPLRLGVQVFTP
jgi:hypothetical protein